MEISELQRSQFPEAPEKKTMMFFFYNVVLAVAAVMALPYYGLRMALTGKYRRSLGAKLGRAPEEIYGTMTGSPRIWMHAVSVGEVTAAAPILAALRRELPTLQG